MSTLRAINTPTRASHLSAGTYGWLLTTPGNPEPIQRGDKVNLDGTAQLVPTVLPTDPVAYRVLRHHDGTFALELLPGVRVRQAITTPWDRDAVGERIHFVEIVTAHRSALALHLLRDAVRNGKTASFAKEAVLGLTDAVRFRFAR